MIKIFMSRNKEARLRLFKSKAVMSILSSSINIEKREKL